jgi:phage terminase large subunit GpA-like protein
MTGTTDAIAFVVEHFSAGFRQAPKINVWQWADEHRQLSASSSHLKGNWSTKRVPYTREISEALSPDSPYRKIVFRKSTQVGATEVLLNTIGHRIHLAPEPIMLIEPALPDARKVSRHRIAPMIAASPALRAKIKHAKARDSGNTTLMKEFEGGILFLVGANSPKGLSGSPIALLLCDEVDRFPQDVAKEGDPIDLAIRRTSAFPGAKVALFSTPTVRGVSRIDTEYEYSDQRIYEVPCPRCNAMQELRWEGVICEHGADGHRIPDSARYRCAQCAFLIEEQRYKYAMMQAGIWRAQKPTGETAGFHINALYSLLGDLTWASITKWHQEVKNDPPRLKVWVNTALAESFVEDRDMPKEGAVMARAEVYGPKVPMAACVLTAGVDVQKDRVEVELVAWGPGQESWTMTWRQIYGLPGEPSIWRTLDEFLHEPWLHESGWRMHVTATCIDSGDNTEAVYNYVKQYRRAHHNRLWPTKGFSTPGRALVSPPSYKNKAKVPLVMIGSDTARDVFYGRVKIPAPGPGFVHTHAGLPAEYYTQLLSEVKVGKYKAGKLYEHYEKKSHVRNEVLACRVENICALALLNPNLAVLHAKLVDRPAPVLQTATPTAPKPKPHRRRRRGGYLSDLLG